MLLANQKQLIDTTIMVDNNIRRICFDSNFDAKRKQYVLE